MIDVGAHGVKRPKAKLERNNNQGDKRGTIVKIIAIAITPFAALIAYVGYKLQLFGGAPNIPPTEPVYVTSSPTISPKPTSSPTPASTLNSTPTSIIGETSAPTTNPTAEPTPTVTPFVSLFGVTEATRNEKVNIGGRVQVAFYSVNGMMKGYPIQTLLFNQNADGKYVGNTTTLFKGDKLGVVSDQEEPIEINYDYFKKAFNDENVKVEYMGHGDFGTLLGKAEAFGYKVDKSRLDEMTGEKTFEEIENWIREVVPEAFWPIKTSYILYHRTDSQIPRDRDKELVGDKLLFALVIDYQDGVQKVAFAEGSYINNKPWFKNLFKDEKICDADMKNQNKEFFDSIRKGAKIERIYPFDFTGFVDNPYALKLRGALLNLQPTDTIQTVREAYEMLDDQYWYLPPREMNMQADYSSRYISTRDFVQPGITKEIKDGLYTLKDLCKQPSVPMTTEEVLKSIRSGEQDKILDKNAPKQKIYETANL